MRHTLFLTEAAVPLADVYIASDEVGFLVLARGPSEQDLLAHLLRVKEQFVPEDDVAVVSLSKDHAHWTLSGPYAWEIAAAFLGPSVMGMPYLSLLVVNDVFCFRAGNTGEYGYDFLVPRAAAQDYRKKLMDAGAPRGLQTIGRAALDLAALENWYFNPDVLRNAPWASSLTPIELQLQCQVDYRRDFWGADALRARRAEGANVRVTCFTAPQVPPVRSTVSLEGRALGQILAADWSHTRGECVGIALLAIAYAHPHIDAFVATVGQKSIPMRTHSAPVLNNRSLYVNPHRHTYASRDKDTFPPLVLP
jgi:glycine cleavage system aminomethyltransferase T